jgi:hypothetical protein
MKRDRTLHFSPGRDLLFFANTGVEYADKLIVNVVVDFIEC